MSELILSFFSQENKLRVSTLYHLLKGKRTSSILLFGFFYQLLPYLGAFPHLQEANYYQQLRQLEKQQLLRLDEETALLTSKGQKQAEAFRRQMDVSAVDYYRYGKTDAACWRLTKLMVQVLSFYQAETTQYVPLEAQPYFLFQIKKWLPGEDRFVFSEQAIHELRDIFQQLPEETANYLANQFTGQRQQGKTRQQLIPETQQQEPLAQLYNSQQMHQFISMVDQGSYPLIKSLLKDLLSQNYNRSMLQTRALFVKGASKQQVMKERNLKEGTINDHILEWAILDKEFPFSIFLPEKLAIALQQEPDILAITYQAFNEKLPCSYDQFRLGQIVTLRKEGW